MGKNVKRLYADIKPSHYDLKLDLDKENLVFSGSLKVRFEKTGRPSKRVTFHQKDLEITGGKLWKISKKPAEEIELSRINTQQSLDEARLHAKETLYPGEYQADFQFEGKITDHMHGLYPCYFNHGGKKKVMLATQFESHHAREVFPCIDEPEAKATFQLTLITPDGLDLLSNTPIESQKRSGKKAETKFEKTPVMSSYLLAFAVGELHNVEAKTKNGITMRTWATVAQPKKFLEYANKEAVRILDFFTEYFQTPYPLKKCDQLALPDFETGAMENWGLITYREVALLTDPDNRSLSSEQYISMVVAHELSHQWFGNLVTMRWWDDLWLNESFASLVEHIALDALHPDWKWWEHYVISDVLVTANRDIYKDVQPVGVDVTHPDEILTLFDPAIVYTKGGRLLKMMREFIGEKAFRNGLKKYFAKHAYKNAERGDLWEALSASSRQDVASLMNPWIEQSGMPMLSVSKKGRKIQLNQKRFLLDDEDPKKTWPIALLADKDLPVKVFDKKSGEIAYDKPVLFNTRGSGHYLVNYKDEETKKLLSKSIANQSIPAEGRIIRLNDIILLAKKGESSLTEALDIVKDCRSEPREAVWSMMNRTIGFAKLLVEGDEQTEQAIKDFRLKLANPQYKKLGWEHKLNEDPNNTLLRQTVLGIMLAGDSKEIIDQSISIYNKSTEIDRLPADLRTIILASVVRTDNKKEINRMLEVYKNTSNSDLQHSLCAALCDTKNPDTAELIIKKTIGKDGFVRPQDIFRWFAYLMRNQYTRKLAWQWLTTDWKRLEKVFGGSKIMDYVPVYSARPLSTPEWKKKYQDFFTPLISVRSLERNIKIGFSEIDARIEWRKREEPRLKKYFN